MEFHCQCCFSVQKSEEGHQKGPFISHGRLSPVWSTKSEPGIVFTRNRENGKLCSNQVFSVLQAAVFIFIVMVQLTMSLYLYSWIQTVSECGKWLSQYTVKVNENIFKKGTYRDWRQSTSSDTGIMPIAISVLIHLLHKRVISSWTEGSYIKNVYKGMDIGIKLLPGYTVWCGCVSAFQDISTVYM